MSQIEKFLARVGTGEDTVSRLDLCHVVGANKIGDTIWRQSTDRNCFTADGCVLLSNAIRSAAEMDAAGHDIVQQYILRAYDASDKMIGRVTIRAAPPRDETGADAEINSEPPSSAGLVKQAMRHAEVFAQLSAQGQAAMFTQMSRTIEMLAKQNQNFQERHAQFLEQMEELTTMRHEREIELKRADAKAKAIGEMTESVKLLLPAVASKLTGGKIGSDLVHKEQIKAIAKSITPDQLQEMAKILKPAQAAAVFELFSNAADGDEEIVTQ